MALNVTTAVIGSGCNTATASPSLVQWDVGQVLKIEGVDLPAAYQVEFSTEYTRNAIPQIGDENGVAIPNELLQRSAPITAYIVLHEGLNDREREYWITIYITPGTPPETITPDPEQMDVIDETIAALQAGVAAAEAAAQSVQNMGVEAETLPEGSEASVEKTVDPETGEVTLSFGIPTGATGATGPAGPQGPQGAAGTTDAGEIVFDDSETYPAGSLGAEVSDAKNAISDYNSCNFLEYASSGDTVELNGVTWTMGDNGLCSYSGLSTGGSFIRQYWIDRYHMPSWMTAGNSYHIKCTTTDSNVSLSFVFYTGGNILSEETFTSDGNLNVPATAEGVQIRYYTATGNNVSGTIKGAVLNTKTNADLTSDIATLTGNIATLNTLALNHSQLDDNTNLDDVKNPGYYLINSSRTYTNNPLPSGTGGHLLVFPTTSNTVLQLIFAPTRNSYYSRQSSLGSFSGVKWAVQNNYLPPLPTAVDRTAEIQYMLDNFGVCRLGVGTYRINSGINMPANSIITGCGKGTIIEIADTVTSGYAIKMNNYCTVSDLLITSQGFSSYTPSATVGNVHGILYQATADAVSDPTTLMRCMIDNCFIRGLNGGGITCNNSGTRVNENLVVTNCHIWGCDAGINIAYRSEFHRFTNVSVTGCYYGCIDNGGNCNFGNCSFSGNTIGLLMDNSNSQSYNSSHGTFSACAFNHSGNNIGTAIKILGMKAGEIFTGCQIFFGEIIIDESVGIRFVGANLGRQVPITVTDSQVVTFSDSTFYDATSTTLTQSGNTMLKFSNCYLRDGTAFNPVTQVDADSGVYESLTSTGTYTISADNLESGQWSYSRKDDNAARARTTFLIPVYAGMSISYENTTFDVYFGVLPTPTSMEYYPNLSGWRTGNSGVFDITSDGYLTFNIRNHADTTVTVDPADFDSVVTICTAQSNAIDQKQDATSYVTLSGTIVTQIGADNTMYLCGELAELTFTAPATGQTAIRFSSGTTPTVATFSGVTWLNGFDPSAIEASKTYEVNILNGLGCAAWT